MGTRADFYVGTGRDAEWIGSVAWDGYEWDENKHNPISTATTEEEYRVAVATMLASRDDATLPSMGWPWPWDDSNTTDYVYAFHDGKVTAITTQAEWPDMSARSNVTIGSKRSGVIVITGSQ